MVQNTLMEVFAVDPLLATVTTHLLELLPPQFTLADLSTHDLLERDASLVHDDAVFERDTMLVNHILVAQLLDLTTGDGPVDDRLLTMQVLAQYRRNRSREAAAINPEFHLLASQKFQIVFEVASLLVVMGDRESATISVRHARSTGRSRATSSARLNRLRPPEHWAQSWSCRCARGYCSFLFSSLEKVRNPSDRPTDPQHPVR